MTTTTIEVAEAHGTGLAGTRVGAARGSRGWASSSLRSSRSRPLCLSAVFAIPALLVWALAAIVALDRRPTQSQ
jgi:hypothetical protein